MKKRMLALMLCLALALTLTPALAAEPVYFPELAQELGGGLAPNNAWPAVDSSLVPSQTYFGINDWDDCLDCAGDYIALLEGTGEFAVVSPLKVVSGKEGGETVQYAADLRYTGAAAMKGTLKAMRADRTWPDYGEYHITVRAEHDGSRPNAARQNSIVVRWDAALRPAGIDFSAAPEGGDEPEETGTAPGNASVTPGAGTAIQPSAGNADNTFQDLGSALGYYLRQEEGENFARYEDKTKSPVSYEMLLQLAQEYVDLLVGQDNFFLVSPFAKNDYGGTQTAYIRYTGTAPMEENLSLGDSISWFHYSPYHITVSVTQSDREDLRYITVAWDNGLRPVESTRRTASGARLGSAEKPREALTVVLGINYNMMCVGDEVVLVDDEDAQVCPVIQNERTMVPVSRIVAAFGGQSTWDGAKRATGFYLDELSVTHTVGTAAIRTGTGQTITMDTPSTIMRDRTYVPVRYILEALGLWVGYEPKYKLVVVSTEDLDGEDLLKLPESQRLFASEPVPDTPRKTTEHYAIDGFNYTMEVGEAMTLYNSRSAISGYSAYTWDVLEGGELVSVDRNSATCRFYAKRPGVVTIQSHMDESIVGYSGGTQHNEVTYTMTITIVPATETGSAGGLMHWQPCYGCDGTGTMQVSGREITCTVCLGQKQILM